MRRGNRNIVWLCLLGALLWRGPLWALTPRELTDPVEALSRASAPLNGVESLLAAQERDAVRAYREKLIEEGRSDAANRVRCLEELYAGNNAGALQALELLEKKDAWATSRVNYLTGLMDVQRSFARTKSDHFIFLTRSEDAFLGPTALPSLENAYARVAEFFGSSPTVAVQVEVYPTVDSFVFASTLSRETIERTGAVASVAFGRVMALSPEATAFGYRWMDFLVHEYVHSNLTRVSGGNCPIWLQEGTARFLETGWRRPEGFTHTPSARALLTRAVLSDTSTVSGLLTFGSMEPSFLRLESQEKASLAFAETSDAVDFIVREFGQEKLRDLLIAFRSKTRAEAFQSTLGMTEAEFEKNWRDSLADLTEVPTELARGALTESIRLGTGEDLSLVGPDIQNFLRLGDRLRQQGSLNGAIVEYKKAVDLEPDNGVALTRLARAYVGAEKASSAEELLKRVMEKNHAYASSFVMLGDLFFDDGRYEEAQTVLQQALEINPFHPKIHEVLGLIAVDVGNFVLARQSLNLALRFDPNNDAVRQALKRMPKGR
ncbi:MAG: tetratricopeptide repeat protein [Elusimicrobia bacterium]|nr:tetratricopeptide repeat protein [Elusimicrobiota bacterium]